MDRTKLRETITNILQKSIDLRGQEYIVEELVKAIMRLSMPTESWPLEWKILHGEQVEQSDLERARWEQDTLIEFEQLMGYSKLPWGSTPKWRRLERHILTRKLEDPDSLAKFAKASRAEYSTFKPPKIYQDPDLAVAIWPLAVTPPITMENDQQRIIAEVANGINV